MVYWCAMKHTKTIIALGIVVALVPFLGFPSSWKSIIFAAVGLAIAALAFRMLAHPRIPISPENEEHTTFQQSAMPDTQAPVAHE